MIIIDGRKIRKTILEDIKKDVAELSFKPVFCDVLVGEDPASLQYIQMKAKTAEEMGMEFHKASFASAITTEELVEEIKKLNSMPRMCGLIIQLPLPEHIDTQTVLNAIDPAIDVDCLNTFTSKGFYNGEHVPAYPAALACITILDSLNIDLTHKKIVVLGQGMLVGKPVTHLLRERGLAVETIDRSVTESAALLKEADVIISAIGQGKYLRGDMIKEGSIVIDAGTSESNGGIIGDVDFDSVKEIAAYISPVPGGVGPVTVSKLFSNVLAVAKQKNDNA